MFRTTIFSTIMANYLLNYELNLCWSSYPWIKGLKLKADAGKFKSCEYVNYHLHSNHKTSIFGFNERPYACLDKFEQRFISFSPSWWQISYL